MHIPPRSEIFIFSKTMSGDRRPAHNDHATGLMYWDWWDTGAHLIMEYLTWVTHAYLKSQIVIYNYVVHIPTSIPC